MDGQYSVKENMQYTNGLGSEDLNTFTLCLRFKVEFLRPEHTTILSYSTFNSDNAFGTYLWLQSGSTLNLGFCKYWDDLVTGHCNYSPLKSIKIPNTQDEEEAFKIICTYKKTFLVCVVYSGKLFYLRVF